MDVQPGERIYNPHEQVYLVCTEGGHYLLQTLDNIFLLLRRSARRQHARADPADKHALGRFLHFTYTVHGTFTDISAGLNPDAKISSIIFE